MPTTYTHQQAIDHAKAFLRNIPTQDIEEIAADRVYSQIWVAFPWPWTLSQLTAIALTDDVQDYSIAAADVTTGFYRLVYARIVRTDITPDEFRELIITDFLPPELTRKGGLEQIRYIARDKRSGLLRLEMAVSEPAGVTLEIQGDFQRTPTKVDNTVLSNTLTLPDHYFPVYVEGIKWQFYRFADDPRAGVAQVDGRGNKVYTGQLGTFMGMLDDMKRAEDTVDQQAGMFPDDPIGGFRGGDLGPRVFGW